MEKEKIGWFPAMFMQCFPNALYSETQKSLAKCLYVFPVFFPSYESEEIWDEELGEELKKLSE